MAKEEKNSEDEGFEVEVFEDEEEKKEEKEEKNDYFELEFDEKKFKKILYILIIGGFILINGYSYLNKPVEYWWDEAEYLSYVNYIVKGAPHELWAGRAILFPLILSIFGFISTNEIFLKIVLLFITLFSVLVSYFVFSKIFDRDIGFLSSVLLMTNWLFLSISNRFLTGIPSTIFLLLTVYFFIKKGVKNRLLSGIFMGLAVSTRFTSVFLIPALVFYDILDSKSVKDFFSKKQVWVLAVLIGLLPVFVFSGFSSFKHFFLTGTGERLGEEVSENWFFYIQKSVVIFGPFYLFFLILGLPVLVINWNKKDFRNNLLLLIMYIISHWIGYSFLTPHKEMRYILPIVPFLSVIAGYGVLFFYSMMKNSFKKTKISLNKKVFGLLFIFWIIIGVGVGTNLLMMNSLILFFSVLASIIMVLASVFGRKQDIVSKIISLVIIGFLLSYSGYINHSIFENAVSSQFFAGFRDIGNYIKEHSPSSEIVMTNAGPYVNYFSEREVVGFPNNSEIFNQTLHEFDVSFIVLSKHEGFPNYLANLSSMTNFTVPLTIKVKDVPVFYVFHILEK